jgi:hypothetical protein
LLEGREKYLEYLGFEESLGRQQLIKAAEEILEKNEVLYSKFCKIG